MRIGTWNLAGSWSADHASVLLELDCDVLLLTECPAEATLPAYVRHSTEAVISGTDTHWSTVLSTRPMEPLPDPHPASAAVLIEGVVFCASVLPWPLAGDSWPWGPQDHPSRMQRTLVELGDAFGGRSVVWGGDWNQPLSGSLAGFSRAARDAIATSTEALGLQVPTRSLPGRTPGQDSIDHLAVPSSWTARGGGCVPVDVRLSDHDAYWVDVGPRSDE